MQRFQTGCGVRLPEEFRLLVLTTVSETTDIWRTAREIVRRGAVPTRRSTSPRRRRPTKPVGRPGTEPRRPARFAVLGDRFLHAKV
jgi:hypothetical protein